MTKPVVEHIITRDGSSTLYAPGFDEHYHSVHGAIQESMHVFIGSGLNILEDRTSVSIFEMGFGTGLNALLTYLYANGKHIHYTGIEAFPLSVEQVKEVNYPAETGHADATRIFLQLHQAAWEEDVVMSDFFTLHKIQGRLEEFNSDRKFDLVYFDAFGPNSQPELWEEPILEKIYHFLNPGAVFVTYSAKSSVRRGLLKAGFQVEKIPGPPGKREMLRATRI